MDQGRSPRDHLGQLKDDKDDKDSSTLDFSIPRTIHTFTPVCKGTWNPILCTLASFSWRVKKDNGMKTLKDFLKVSYEKFS